MKKKELLLMLNEGLTTEEVPSMINLEEIKDFIDNITMDDKTKKKIMDKIKILEQQTIFHSSAFSKMVKEVLKSDKDEY